MLDAVINRPRLLLIGFWSILQAMPSFTTKMPFTRSSRESDPKERSGMILVFHETSGELFLPFWGGYQEKRGPIVNLGKARFVITKEGHFEDEFQEDNNNRVTVDVEEKVRADKKLIPYKPEKYQKLYTLG